MLEELYGAFFFIFILIYLSCLEEFCNADVLQKCFVDYETSHVFPSAWDLVDNDKLYFLDEFIL